MKKSDLSESLDFLMEIKIKIKDNKYKSMKWNTIIKE